MTGTTCSEVARDLGEPPAGKLSQAQSWVLLEYPGPWPAKARSVDLPGPAGARLRGEVDAAGAKFLLVRQGHTEVARPRLWVADVRGLQPSLRCLRLDSYDDLAGVSLADAPGWDTAAPMALVCTHGRHDQCCALRGTAAWKGLSSALGDRAFQCSHIGGDRFAANLLLLPHAFVYGGAEDAAGGLAAAYLDGRLGADHYRGRGGLEPAAQAAEWQVRQDLGDSLPGDVLVSSVATLEPGRWRVALQVRSLGQVREVTRVDTGVRRLEACADAEEQELWFMQVTPALDPR